MSKSVVAILAFLIAIPALAQGPSTISKDLPKRDESTQDLQPSLANKRLVIAKLKTIQSKETQLISEIDDKLKGKLKETQDVNVSTDAFNSEIRISKLEDSMESLEKKRREAVERSQFIDRLIFAVDSKWSKNSLKDFLEQSLLDIASTEMNQTDSKTPSNLWKFCTYLSIAVRDLPEPREDIIAFIDNYLDYSSIQNPKPPTAFAQSRSYTNGVESEAAKVTKQEDLGDGVERKVKPATSEPPAVIQGTTSAPLEPPQPREIPMSAPNPLPSAAPKK